MGGNLIYRLLFSPKLFHGHLYVSKQLNNTLGNLKS